MENTLERWAKSLVGRDWEIYWSEGSHSHSEREETADDGEDMRSESAVAASGPSGAQAEGGGSIHVGDKEGEEEEDEEDEEDWYDGHIEEIESVREDGSYSFRIRFVGDETIYTMLLDPSIVRPSARAWIKRSKAILGSNSRSIGDWEKSLPPDTRTLEDAEELAQLGSSLQACNDFADQGGETPLDAAPSSSSEVQTHGMPDATELNRIHRLASLLSEQLYLRTKLAPIVEHTGGPSEAYVDHLLQCLKCLDEASQWYVKCWRLHRVVCSGPSSSSSSDPANLQGVARLDEDYAIREGLQEGRRVITHLLRVDTSLAGSKRRRPAETSPGGTRKTKRRRRNKSLLDFIKESERGSKTPKPDEDEFLSSDAVANFVDQVQCSDARWYTRHLGKMLQSVSLNIVSPLLVWRCKVETMLGDRPEAEAAGDHTDGETSEEDSDEEINETTGSNQSEQRFYTFDEIKSFEDSGNHDELLRHFDLSRLQNRLGVKLSDIVNFERSCWASISQVFCAPVGGEIVKESDNIYSQLESLKASAMAATASLNNVNPLGSSSSVLDRKVLDDALTLRAWYLDLHRVESSRERLVFIDKMATRASELPRLPHCEYSASLDGLFDEAVARLRKISQGYFDHLTRFNKYRSILLSRLDPSTNDEGVNFTTVEGVSSALASLGEIQVLSIAEEMLSVRLDVLRWKSEAESKLAKPKISFGELVVLKTNLDKVQQGCSPARSQILVSIETNEKVNAEIRSFAEADVTAFCGSIVSMVNSKHALSCTWKERADAIVCAIQQHCGNQSAVQKPLPMVDLKRVSGLMRDYEDSGIFLPDDLSFLRNVYESATKWSEELTNFLLEDRQPFANLLSRLQSSKSDRPKGIIVDPARHLVDNLVDLLAWHQQTIQAMNETSSGNIIEGGEDGAPSASISSIPRCVYSLVAEGSEILEKFGSTIDFAVNSVSAQNFMYKQLDSRRPMRVISRTKLESSTLGKSMLDRIITMDAREGSPLRFLSLILWQASLVEFLDKYKSKKGTKDTLSLESARGLLSKRPRPVSTDCASASAGVGATDWGVNPTREENSLMELIAFGEKSEDEALRILASSKDLLRGLSRRVDAIHEYFASVKDLLGRFKAPSASNGSGLALSKTLEQQLDQLSKTLGWLVRTFPYPFLYQVACDITPESRIPWDVLVSLNERKPAGLETYGDCAGIALRVAEVFEAGTAWNQLISKFTNLSFRGGRRRGEETEGGAHPTVDVETVRRLVRDPVLRKVAMPRESAVTEILESAKTFEVHLHNFLGKDFDGIHQDRAPYPDSRSLLGRSGEFLLYRLTGSPLYNTLMSSIEHISSIAQDVFADTPGKVAFEWIRQAVSWIDSIRAAVKSQSYAAGMGIERLVIGESEARAILDNGKSFFLDIPEDLKKTLSTHRIFMSTNKISQKLKVVFKKGGAHHSVGGTAIKWCPILFDSLRADISRLDVWKSQVQKVQLGFEEFSTKRNGSFTRSEEDVLSLTSFHEELVMLLEEGIESLVVAPAKGVLDAIHELHKELQTHLQDILKEHSSIILNERIAKRKFEDHEQLIKDRFDLLDALLARSSIEFENSQDQSDNIPSCDAKPSDHYFRDTCRCSIEDALQSAAMMIGLGPGDEDTDSTLPVSTHYAMKAGEIEHALYTRFQVNSNATMMSFDYKEKSRTICWVLGDCINPKLCIQVLLGETDAVSLVSLQEKELIGEWKALPDPDSGNMQMSDPEVNEDGGLVHSDSIDSDCDPDMKTADSSKVPETESKPQHAGQVEVIEDSANVSTLSGGFAAAVDRPEAPPSLAASASTTPTPTPTTRKSTTTATTTTTSAARSASKRPHAPPSLAASLVSSATSSLSKRGHASSKPASTGKTSRKGKYLMNSSGYDSFLLAVSKPWIKFKARFHPESDRSLGGLNCVLPESLSEKGRLRLEEFSKFLSGKLKGGKWTVIVLRMSISSDEDAKKLKKFYKEYESMKRISMFSVSENCKLFLVTPKFHRVATKIIGSSFGVDSSTYAIALTRG